MVSNEEMDLEEGVVEIDWVKAVAKVGWVVGDVERDSRVLAIVEKDC